MLARDQNKMQRGINGSLTIKTGAIAGLYGFDAAALAWLLRLSVWANVWVK